MSIFAIHRKSYVMRYLIQKIIRYWWEILVVLTAILGISFGIIGFRGLGTNASISDSLYNTFRMFVLNHEFDGNINASLEISRWLIFATFILVSFRLFITIIAPKFIQHNLIRYFYQDHIVICGLNNISMELIKKYSGKKIVVISTENNQYVESLKQRKIKTVIGESTDIKILSIARVDKAECLYAITDDDKKNIEIAQAAFLLKQGNTKEINLLKCYTLVKDSELKNILEDSDLFKYTVKDNEYFFFDGILFNINELGIQYGICNNIEYILPHKMQNYPNFLIIGLTDIAKNIIFNLAHCTTMNRENFHFTVIEENQSKIECFKKKFGFIERFANIEYTKEINSKQSFSSVFVALENQVESMKMAVFVRRLIRKEEPAIFVFCDKPECLGEVLNKQEKEVRPLIIDSNIHLINSFEEAFEFVVNLNVKIEDMAEKAHNIWRKSEKDKYELLSEHFKQSNRNQVIDNYIRAYLLTGKTLDALSNQHIPITMSDADRETMAIEEHRRWMIEKYINGWQYGIDRDNNLKIHPSLKSWEENLSDEDKEKDFKAIDLMMQFINKKA